MSDEATSPDTSDPEDAPHSPTQINERMHLAALELAAQQQPQLPKAFNKTLRLPRNVETQIHIVAGMGMPTVRSEAIKMAMAWTGMVYSANGLDRILRAIGLRPLMIVKIDPFSHIKLAEQNLPSTNPVSATPTGTPIGQARSGLESDKKFHIVRTEPSSAFQLYKAALAPNLEAAALDRIDVDPLDSMLPRTVVHMLEGALWRTEANSVRIVFQKLAEIERTVYYSTFANYVLPC
ncbi:hypothetical protein BZA70DRAFT_287178 [Myxozyma melibiosi]|uniref:Uncharacterized protein n=1 Tax=Myxozyma melibiosi TaxID=54550 RepID=A0ABR1FDL5_9ASCO